MPVLRENSVWIDIIGFQVREIHAPRHEDLLMMAVPQLLTMVALAWLKTLMLLFSFP
jgi:hypothetical protein